MKLPQASNRKLTLLRKLGRKKYRLKEQLFLAEGVRAVKQIIKNGSIEISELFFDENQIYWQENYWKSVAEILSSSIVTNKDFSEISDTDNPQGVIALCRIPDEMNLDDMAKQSGIIIASDAIQDPGNTGTIIRTANWFGVKGLLAGKGTVGLFHPKVVRATAGATGVIPYANVKLQESLSFFEEKGWQSILLDVASDSVQLTNITKAEKMIVIVGNEANGIDPQLFHPSRQKARLGSPENAGVESLNVAVSMAVSLYALSD